MTKINIVTVAQLRREIRRTNGRVFVQPRIGNGEHWTMITKKEALAICNYIGDLSPKALEMGGDQFADIDDFDDIYIG